MRIIKHVNDIACGDGGWLLGSCKQSMTGQKNYLLLAGIAAAVQYVLPIAIIIVIVQFSVISTIADAIIDLLCLFNPFFVLMYIPLAVTNTTFAAALIIGFLIGSIMYWYFYFREIGIFMFFPIMAWLISIATWFIPAIGPFMSIIISLVPWLPMMSIVHWWTYRN